jgi:exopolysaccharide biosynthesis polyprenyl glycosylphosphotransferase
MTTSMERSATTDGPAGGPLATVPWPFVERRLTPRAPTDQVPVPVQRHRDDSARAPDPALAPPQPETARWTRRLVLAAVALDATAGLLAALGAYTLRFGGEPGGERYLLGLVIAPVVWVVAVALSRGYESRWFGSGSEEFRCVLRGALVVGGGAATVSYALRAELARGYVLTACVLVVAGSTLGRVVLRMALHAARRRGHAKLDVVLVGHESTVCDLVRQVVRERNGAMRVAGACVPGGHSSTLETLGVPVLGDLHHASEVVRRLAIHTVAVTACAEMSGPALRRLAWDLEGSGVDLVVAPGLVEVAGPRLHIRPLCGLPLLHVEQPEMAGARRLIKGVVDRVLAALALVLLAPFLLGVACAVLLSSPGPVLFSQTRVGKGGREFTIRKFRTMHVDAEERLTELRSRNVHGDEVLFKLRQDPRVTSVGRMLRRFSLDELPQLVNVLAGQMSVVGPRPPLPQEVARYGHGVHRRLLVKPGVTGLWQISGRSDLSWHESIRLDLRYVENWSLSLDLMIMWKTVAAVLGGRGAY